jgi:hypothetical protein
MEYSVLVMGSFRVILALKGSKLELVFYRKKPLIWGSYYKWIVVTPFPLCGNKALLTMLRLKLISKTFIGKNIKMFNRSSPDIHEFHSSYFL